MIKKYVYGKPFETDAVVCDVAASAGNPVYGSVSLQNGFCFSYTMHDRDIVYGLGEAVRGINKRGNIYISDCTDIPHHHEDTLSLYAAHNFIVISGERTFGLFIDYPTRLVFDIGYTKMSELVISAERADLKVYIIDGESPLDIVKQFRKLIGKSYIPPKFAFGYGQSRWGYKTAEDFRKVVKQYRENHVPIDMLYMDIDYMDSYKDFTVNEEEFPDFKAFVDEMKGQNIHLVPIIDAGVKIEAGYDVYEEGKRLGYFCKKADGSDFEAAVWPGLTHFPDVLNPDARVWFGEKYGRLIEAGIDGFWNDMNEPAIFYTPEGIEDFREFYDSRIREGREVPVFELRYRAETLANSQKDYQSFYHNVNGEMVKHSEVHNLFGFNMTRAAAEGFEKVAPDKKLLLFSRSSYIGMHRYAGLWTGDNNSWWSHLLMNLKMLPALNMCGFLYVGADLGGFGCNTTRDLLLRWLALGVFTPLMRNHSANGTREQEVYRFENIEDFKAVIGVRYRLLPYLYKEYLRAAEEDDMMFKPLSFVYPNDERARTVEDQLMLGDELMIAPVYEQNAAGRVVYLPEEMMLVKFMPDGSIFTKVLPQGHTYVDVALNEVSMFIRKGRSIEIVDAAECVDDIDMNTAKKIGY